jgi:hypothetical protein
MLGAETPRGQEPACGRFIRAGTMAKTPHPDACQLLTMLFASTG